MSNEPKKKDINKQLRQVNLINVIAAVYVLYLAYQLLSTLVVGEVDANGTLWCIGGGVVFILGGGWLLRREWKNFNRIEEDDEEAPAEELPAPEAGDVEEEEVYDEIPEEWAEFLPREGVSEENKE